MTSPASPPDPTPPEAAKLRVPECLAAAVALTVMSILPVSEMFARQFRLPGIPGSTVFVQHLTLWIAFLGAVLASGSDRLLALTANTFLRRALVRSGTDRSLSYWSRDHACARLGGPRSSSGRNGWPAARSRRAFPVGSHSPPCRWGSPPWR